MRKVLLALALIGLSPFCAAQTIGLVCIGWAPVYKSLAGHPMNPNSGNDSMVIHLDMVERVATYRTQLGEVKTRFTEGNGFYYGKTDVGAEVLGKFVTLINLSIERMTGSTLITFAFKNEDDRKVAFSGKCAPGKPLF